MLVVLTFAAAAESAGQFVRTTRPATTIQSIQLRPDQLLAYAEAAQLRGDLATAAAAYDALSHDHDPDIRNEARFRKAKLLLAKGELTAAALLLRQILDDKPKAAPVRLELARVLDRLGDKEGAWRQVRAAQASGLPPAVARLVDRYTEALREQRPFGASIEVTVAPDSNINHATSSDKLGTIFGDFEVSDGSKAKSGTGIAVSGQAYRRFALDRGGPQLLVRLGALASLYRKSKFNDVAVDLAIGPELQLGSNRINLEAGVTQRWYAQKAYMRSARIGLTAARPIGRTSQLRFVGTAALVDNQINRREDGKSYSAQLSFEHALSADTGFSLSASGTRESVRDPGYSTTGWRLGLLAWRDVGRMTLSGGLDVGRLYADERFSLFPNKRLDRFARFSVGATFRQFQWHSFAPVFRFSIERNRSTIAFYDYRRTRAEIGVVRPF